MANDVVRIKVKSFEHDLLDAATKNIVELAVESGADVIGPVPLPTKKVINTILRSPHVNKKSREQFEIKRHRRLIELKGANKKTVDNLLALKLPAGVDIELKI